MLGATRGKQGLAVRVHLKFLDFHTRKMGKTPQNMPQNSEIPYYHPT